MVGDGRIFGVEFGDLVSVVTITIGLIQYFRKLPVIWEGREHAVVNSGNNSNF